MRSLRTTCGTTARAPWRPLPAPLSSPGRRSHRRRFRKTLGHDRRLLDAVRNRPIEQMRQAAVLVGATLALDDQDEGFAPEAGFDQAFTVLTRPHRADAGRSFLPFGELDGAVGDEQPGRPRRARSLSQGRRRPDGTLIATAAPAEFRGPAYSAAPTTIIARTFVMNSSNAPNDPLQSPATAVTPTTASGGTSEIAIIRLAERRRYRAAQSQRQRQDRPPPPLRVR